MQPDFSNGTSASQLRVPTRAAAGRHERRLLRLSHLLVALVLGALAFALPHTASAMTMAATGGATAIPSNFFVVVDSGGANDVNSAQVDLTQMGRDDSDSTVYKLFWSWDATDQWTGNGQTGDACALFDSNGNGDIDFVVCGQIENPKSALTTVQQTTGSPYAFSCSDGKNDRCTNPTPTSFTPDQVKSGVLSAGDPGASPPGDLITATDPFTNVLPDQDWPNDSTLDVVIAKSFLPAGSVLVNVCSYPSAGNGGNNNPFDCIVNPGGGFLNIVKSASGADAASTAFPFTVDPGSLAKSITGSGNTGAFPVPVGTSYSVAEAVPSGWKLTAASCTLENGGGATGSLSGSTISGVTIQSGKVTTCTFTDVQDRAALSIDKTSSTTAIDHAGQVVPYAYLVTNTGNLSLTGITVTDDKVASVSCPATALAPGASMTCTGSYTASQALIDAGGSLVNVATADSDQTGPATDTVSIPIAQTKTISIDKSSTTTLVDHDGQVVPYSYLVTNTGNVTLTGVVVTDDKVASVSCPATTLAPAASMTCTGSHAVTSAEWDARTPLVNVATADSDQTGPVTDTLSIPMAQTASMSIDKTSTTTAVDHAGQVVPYGYLVTNTGTTALTGITVGDDKVASVSCPATTLAAKASMTCTGSYTVGQADIDAGGNLVNVATADSAETDPVTDTLSIPITQAASLAIDKTSTTTVVDHVGQVVEYAYLVTNTGKVTLTGIAVDDDKVASVSCPAPTLAPAASMTCTGSHTVTQAELNAGGNLVNVAAADSDQTAPVTDTLSIPITQRAAMSVDKSATATVVDHAGQVVDYEYVVANTGNVDLTGITVGDDKVAAVSCPATTLAPAASMTCTGSHTVTQAEMDGGGNLVNLATADSDQTEPVTDTVSIPITQTKAMSIDKTSTTTLVDHAGQLVTYEYLVTNTGNVSLTGITVVDDKVATVTCPATTLAPDEHMTCTGSHTVTQTELNAGGKLTNVATADSEQTEPVTDTLSIPITRPATLTVIKHVVNDNGGTKSASDFTLSVGGKSFAGSESGTVVTIAPGAYTVTESGPAGYAASSSAGCTGTIAEGESRTCTVTNDDVSAPQPQPTPTPQPEPPKPVVDLSITKVDSPDPVTVGAQLRYTLVVTNKAGAAFSASNVTVADPLPAGVTFVSASASRGTCAIDASGLKCNLGTLAAGDSVTIRLIARARVAGTLTNTAVVLSTEPDADPSDNTASAVTRAQGPFTPPAICASLRVRPMSVTVGNRTIVLVVVRDQRGKPLAKASLRMRGPGIDVRGKTDAKGTWKRALKAKRPGIVTVRVPGPASCIGRLGVVGIFQPPVTG